MMHCMKSASYTPSILLLLLTLQPGLAEAADYTKDPVLLVHGYFVGDTATWFSIKSRLIDDGWPEEYLYEAGFENVVGCNPEHGLELAAKVQQMLAETGKDKVDILAHSMGAIDTRYYIKFLCGYKYVRDVVMLGGANKGTIIACAEPISCGADSMCVGNDEGDWVDNTFLLSLNSCDMTPGDGIKYTSVWSSWDEIIIPQENSIIDGALNHKLDAWGVGHGGLLLNGEAYEWAKVGLDGGGTNDNVPTGVGPCYTVCEDPVNPDSAEPVVEPVDDIIEQEEVIEPSDLVELSDLTADVVEDQASPSDLAYPDLTPADIADQASPSDFTSDTSLSDHSAADLAQDAKNDPLDKDGQQLSDVTSSTDATASDTSATDATASSDLGNSASGSGGCSTGPATQSSAAPLLFAFLLACFALLRHLRSSKLEA